MISNSEEQRPSIDPDNGQSKKCYICNKGFNFRKKHICRFCSNSVCIDHCQKARTVDGFDEPQPICDLCNIETMKKEMQNEMRTEIQSLEDELRNARTMHSRLEREHFEKTAVISKLENEISDFSTTSKKELQELREMFVVEEIKHEETKKNHEKTSGNNKKIREDQDRASENLSKAQEELENLRRQSEILKETKDQLNEQLDKINNKIKGSLSIEKVSNLLCQTCAVKMRENGKNLNESPSILEDATVSLSVADERQSIIQSVREYKDILSQQNSRPTEQSGCKII